MQIRRQLLLELPEGGEKGTYAPRRGVCRLQRGRNSVCVAWHTHRTLLRVLLRSLCATFCSAYGAGGRRDLGEKHECMQAALVPVVTSPGQHYAVGRDGGYGFTEVQLNVLLEVEDLEVEPLWSAFSLL